MIKIKLQQILLFIIMVFLLYNLSSYKRCDKINGFTPKSNNINISSQLFLNGCNVCNNDKDCGKNGHCNNNIGRCVCKDGWTGCKCETPRVICNPNIKPPQTCPGKKECPQCGKSSCFCPSKLEPTDPKCLQ